MSINAISNLAVARRPDFEPVGGPPKDLTEMAAAAGRTPLPAEAAASAGVPVAASNGANTALQTLTTYIPTEILTLYVSAIATLGPATAPYQFRRWLPFASFLVITPISVWASFATKVKSRGRPLPTHFRCWPLWEMSAATIAYVAWAFALPETPFGVFKEWYSPGLAGFLVLVVSWGLGMVAPLVQRPLPPTPEAASSPPKKPMGIDQTH